MRILVISDTHIPTESEKLPVVIEQEARKCDCCLHCGDFVSYSVFESLSKLTKTYGVCGNMDEEEVRDKLPLKSIIKLDDVTLGLIHGRGNPANILNYIRSEFSDDFDAVDIFVFGHSHNPLNKKIEGKFYFNPGSPTDNIFAPYRSYGILEINGKDIKGRVLKIE
jgi:hypothetical protein